MRVFLDDRPLSVPRPTLAAAMAAGRSAAEQKHRVIVEAKLNGVAVHDDQLENPPDTDLGDGELRFLTADPSALVATTMHEIADALDAARGTQEAAARAFQRGELSDAFAQLSGALGVWDAVRQGVEQGPALLGRKLSDLRVQTEPDGTPESVEMHLGELAARLGGLRTALQAQDWSTIADELEGEFVPAARRWSGILRELARQCSVGGGGGGGSTR